MSNLVIDFAVNVVKQEAAPTVSLGYIKVLCVAVKPLSTPTNPNGIYEITDKSDIANYTLNSEAGVAFDEGLSEIYLCVTDNLADFGGYFDSFNTTPFFTLVISSDFITTEVALLEKGGFDGVVSYSSTDNVFNETFVLENTSFKSPEANSSIRSFAQLFQKSIGVRWKNLQYLDHNSTESTPIDSLGTADSLYDKRISFYLKQEGFGTYLGSFFHALKPIVNPYVLEEIKLKIQNKGFSFVQQENPYLTPNQINKLGELYSKIITPYNEAGVVGVFSVNLTDDNPDFFTVNGLVRVDILPPVWRQNILLQQID